MATTIPPAHSKIAASLGWETATVGDLWERSDLSGIPACAILRAVQHLEGRHAEHICDLH